MRRAPQLRSPARSSLAFVLGGLLSTVPIAILWALVEADHALPVPDQAAIFLLAALGLAAAVAFHRRRQEVPLAFASGWVLVQAALTATTSEGEWLVVLLLPLAWATLALDLQPSVRLAIALPATLAFFLAADMVASISATAASWSGVVAVLMGAVYFAGWGLRERQSWASHLAWGVTAAWCALAFILALADLFEFLDRVAVWGAVATLALLSAAGFGWVGTHGLRERSAPGPA